MNKINLYSDIESKREYLIKYYNDPDVTELALNANSYEIEKDYYNTIRTKHIYKQKPTQKKLTWEDIPF